MNLNRKQIVAGALLVLACAPGMTAAGAQDEAGEAEAPTGILPIPVYTGSIWKRGYALGDLGGSRTSLAEQGVQFHVDWIQHLQSVVAGGRDTSTEYGASLDYILNLDLDRMGVLPGALISFRGESRYGDSVNALTRTVLPTNTDLAFPLSSEDDIAFTLSELTYTQYLSATVAVFAGKLNTFGGDPNEFAQGRGVSQFGNSDFIFNPVTAFTVPYSTLGFGALWAPSQHLTLIGTVMNTADSSTTSGFDDIGDGATLSVEAQTQYQIGGQPGGQNLGATYAWNGSFADLTGRLSLGPGVGLTVPTTDESYAVYWSAWQYLWSEAEDDSPIRTGDGIPDRRGIGLFARAGYGDDDTSPIEWNLSGGIGGRGLIPGRPNDHFGVGYSYSAIATTRLTGVIGVEDHAQGAEAFYNAELTPAARLTLSVQGYNDVNPSTDTAVTLGMRLSIRF